jgi:predicted DNA binding CopG/RHH family protein
MRNIEQKAALDEYEMADHYDFSGGVRGRFYPSKKVSTTIQIDNDILLFLKKQASEKHIEYQLLINTLLRDYMGRMSKL